jgi:N utilization substance protein B
LVKYTHDHLEEIDQIIENHLSNEWTINNLPKLLFATLRVSICEMKYFPETPRNVIINEYTDIASDMLDEGQVGFVNSVLDKYADKKR